MYLPYLSGHVRNSWSTQQTTIDPSLKSEMWRVSTFDNILLYYESIFIYVFCMFATCSCTWWWTISKKNMNPGATERTTDPQVLWNLHEKSFASWVFMKSYTLPIARWINKRGPLRDGWRCDWLLLTCVYVYWKIIENTNIRDGNSGWWTTTSRSCFPCFFPKKTMLKCREDQYRDPFLAKH